MSGNRGEIRLRMRRRAGDPMAEFDRLPPPLRRWLAGAALPWSPRSVVRAWAAARREARGDPAAALARLDAIQARRLAQEAAARTEAAGPPAPLVRMSQKLCYNISFRRASFGPENRFSAGRKTRHAAPPPRLRRRPDPGRRRAPPRRGAGASRARRP
ncbi:DUF6525 family protein [Albimonas sp. CAU 1670]|uniref:DUF6525 family protein n=1 Tax=Albimonas sp. CAU 1670 TaxID=3032599 RepID=UPI0023D9EFBE|nr:DUF6525 family protein [Albimonas sp. CAU 1670]MDF2235117.1 DUF6525 family protein [Albimonas sp. CAU 1670]